MPVIRLKRASAPKHKPLPFPPTPPVTKQAGFDLAGKIVAFTHEGTEMAGQVCEVSDGEARVRLAVPTSSGILAISDSIVTKRLVELSERDMAWEQRRVEQGEMQSVIQNSGTKAVAVKDDKGVIVDYRDVTISGYGSTFGNVTESDRSGDRVMQGAFRDTIAEFKRNPVMLTDHCNSVTYIAGHYSNLREDENGLFIEGKVSNAPALQTLRFHLMEGNLRTLSMGGIFLYGADGRTIERVHLFEISLVAIPCNPDCIIQARTLDLEGAKKAFTRHKALASIKQGQ
jgi:HK97 family phage prohead protease